MNEQIILEIKNLKTYFYTYEGIARQWMVSVTNWPKVSL